MSDFEVVLTGLIYVFAVLALIILLLGGVSLLVRVMSGAGRGKKLVKVTKKVPGGAVETGKNAGEAARSAGENGSGTGENASSGAAEKQAGEGELVAAISAAITAYRSDGVRPRFRILSFKRIGRD